MDQNKDPPNKPKHIQSNNSLTKDPRMHNGERIASLGNDGEKTGYPHAKE